MSTLLTVSSVLLTEVFFVSRTTVCECVCVHTRVHMHSLFACIIICMYLQIQLILLNKLHDQSPNTHTRQTIQEKYVNARALRIIIDSC